MATYLDRESFDLVSIVDGRKEEEIEKIFAQLGITKEDIHEATHHAKSLQILVAGKSGTGKSTIINGILGQVPVQGLIVQTDDPRGLQESAKVEHRRVCTGTEDIEPFVIENRKGTITVTVWDSRGLLDGSATETQDAKLKEMVLKCCENDIALKMFCIKMNEIKFPNSTENLDVLAMIKITNAFKAKRKNFWENTIIVLTFANMVARHPSYDNLTDIEKKEKFVKEVVEFKDQIYKILQMQVGLSEAEAQKIRVVPAGFSNDKHLPDREYWLASLWIECLLTLPDRKSQGALIKLNEDRLKTPVNVNLEDFAGPIEHQPIVLTPGMAEPTSFTSNLFKVLGCAAGGVVSGAAIGTAALVAGPIGAAIGIPAGALMGFCIGLALGVHKIQEQKIKTN